MYQITRLSNNVLPWGNSTGKFTSRLCSQKGYKNYHTAFSKNNAVNFLQFCKAKKKRLNRGKNCKIHCLNKKYKDQNKRMRSRLIILIGVVFSNGAMSSVSDKSDSINECTHTDQQQNKIPYFRGVPEVPMN